MNRDLSLTKFQIILLLVILAATTIFFAYNKLGFQDNQANAGNARLVIDFGNGTKRAFEGGTVEQMTILQALIASSAEGKFAIDYTINSTGETELKSIAGQTSTNQKKWYVYLDNELVKTSDISKKTIKVQDNIEFRYK